MRTNMHSYRFWLFREFPIEFLINGSRSMGSIVIRCISSFLDALYFPWYSILAFPLARYARRRGGKVKKLLLGETFLLCPM